MRKHEVGLHHKVLNFEPIRKDFNPFALNLNFDWKLPAYQEGSCKDCLQILKDFTKSTEFAESYRSYVRSDLFKKDAQYNLEDFLKFDREFFIIDKTKIQQVLDNPSNTETILSQIEFEALKKQAIERNIISSTEDFTVDDIIDAANYNKEFINKIPTFSELDSEGIVDQIIELVDTDLDITTVNNLIKNALIEQLNKHIFIPYDKIQEVIEEPYNIGSILTKDQFVQLLYRTSSSLSFISQDDIDNVSLMYDENRVNEITTIFTSTEIKVIMDTELNNKSIISNMLTYNGVKEYFNTLKQEFLTINDVNFERIDITVNIVENWINEVN
jgi:hypothetical protein